MCYINSQQTLFEESIVVVGTIPVAARDHSYYFLSLKLLEKRNWKKRMSLGGRGCKHNVIIDLKINRHFN